MHQSFLRYEGGLYLYLALSSALLASVVYLVWEPPGGHNGGTALGYTLGTIAALLIVWLTLLGVRKRAYKSRLGTVQGWLSAHVYLGLALIVIATLHTGFQLGWNIHTLAWVMMMLVILSGMYGVVVYVRLPEAITRNRRNVTVSAAFRGIEEMDNKCSLLVEGLGSPVDRMVITAIQNFHVGGGVWAQLLARDSSRMMVPQEQQKRRVWKSVANPRQDVLLEQLAGFAARSADPQEVELLQQLIDLVAAKRSLVARLLRDIQLTALMRLWLYVHVPLSIALLAALVAHIVSVFYYW